MAGITKGAGWAGAIDAIDIDAMSADARAGTEADESVAGDGEEEEEEEEGAPPPPLCGDALEAWLQRHGSNGGRQVVRGAGRPMGREVLHGTPRDSTRARCQSTRRPGW